MADEAPSTQSSAPKRETSGGSGKQEGRGGGPKRSTSLRGGPQRPHSSTSNREGSDKEQLHRNASGSRGKQASRGRGNGGGRGGGGGGGRKGPNTNNKNTQGGRQPSVSADANGNQDNQAPNPPANQADTLDRLQNVIRDLKNLSPPPTQHASPISPPTAAPPVTSNLPANAPIFHPGASGYPGPPCCRSAPETQEGGIDGIAPECHTIRVQQLILSEFGFYD